MGGTADCLEQTHRIVANSGHNGHRRRSLATSCWIGVRLPRIVSRDMRFLTISEVGHLVDKMPERHRAIVLAAASTGLRFGELAGLRVDRLDLLGRSLTVDATLSEVRGRVALNEPKTKAARRQVALPRFLCDRLARHIEIYPPKMPGWSSSERRVRHCVELTSAVGPGSPR